MNEGVGGGVIRSRRIFIQDFLPDDADTHTTPVVKIIAQRLDVSLRPSQIWFHSLESKPHEAISSSD